MKHICTKAAVTLHVFISLNKFKWVWHIPASPCAVVQSTPLFMFKSAWWIGTTVFGAIALVFWCKSRKIGWWISIWKLHVNMCFGNCRMKVEVAGPWWATAPSCWLTTMMMPPPCMRSSRGACIYLVSVTHIYLTSVNMLAALKCLNSVLMLHHQNRKSPSRRYWSCNENLCLSQYNQNILTQIDRVPLKVPRSQWQGAWNRFHGNSWLTGVHCKV